MITSQEACNLSSACLRFYMELSAMQLLNITSLTCTAAGHARNVKLGGSTTLRFPSNQAVGGGDDNREGKMLDTYDSHEPDASFFHLNTYWPCVVIEISFSQKRKDLKYLAEDYILGSNGDIAVVIGLDIEYTNSKQATLSVWRARYKVELDGQKYLVAAQTVVDQVSFLLISPILRYD